MLDLRRLRILKEFSERRTIAATAEALGYTPSAVSQQLSALEREAGAALLDRTARSAELTESGRLLVEHAEQILAMVEAAESVLAEHRGVAAGQVTVTAFPTGAVAFAPLLARGLRVHENMQLVLRQSMGAAGIRQVASAEVDIALVDDWSGDRPDSGAGRLRHVHLLHDPMVLAVPRGHRLADPAVPVDLRELREEPWIAAPRSEPSRSGIDRLFADVGGAPTTAWEFEGQSTILSLVARGIGIAAVPALALAAGTGGLAFRRLPGVGPTREVYAVVRATSMRRPAIEATLRALRRTAAEVRRDLDAELGAAPG
ncbi:DNA-binding transcriptional LysR family regulator [Streptomonospora nanhaiensis]|uniref:DNA-binding transcriptional LysR family regulator n=1 Tax=Streptomonospora nanhaiensis TaxID=1323731 RepID=A0A853BJB7_9ACTN|nr:LysR family transcriptional regulator [Streptomonospora nanhaiensis]NYI95559.1 DNA-binding transcriptional LysR family regulator [Streptomonospora nanhaiensis]